ncbi:lysyl oxidase-like 5b [Oryzias melastigma]|uniref:Lysyl oxidase homolog n=1 Tax=Oryzias melastigma TaxID=30732 RepID=A0A3B3BZN3_ORYME|nr:lysyl oxidase-like 5b [Oryzias melastigma]
MAKCSLLVWCFFHGLFCVSFGTAEPWRHHIQWENNGQVYSLMSTGSEFQSPVRSKSPPRVFLSSRMPSSDMPGARRRSGPPESRHARTDHRGDAGPLAPERGYAALHAGSAEPREPEPLPGAEEHLGTSPPESTNSSARSTARGDAEDALHLDAPNHPLRALQADPHISADLPPDLPGHFPAATADYSNEINEEDMMNDDPRNPFKNHRNSVFYNLYPSRGRSAGRALRVPGAGHGTRYFQNGLPDLVPDPYAIQAGAYVQRMQMYALRCAAEENCLSRSAYAPTVRDIDFRVLLRFPQKVKNQGTSDFLPLKPRYQWDWHSCHQHFHSMDAFSNYDLLDVVSGLKVAEGHKASFCLEDTGCEPGFRRRYACTSHTQGLSPGCHDTYAANIDCQWIDITDVPPGNYILKVTVNPNLYVLESDFSNNVVRCDVIYTGVYVQTRNCRVTRG